MEKWKDILGFEPFYQVSNTGKVRSYKTNPNIGRILSSKNVSHRYDKVVLRKEGKSFNKYVHRLVAEHFVKKKEGRHHVNHIDGNTRNNFFKNLEFVTPRENNAHARVTGLHNDNGENSKNAKLTQDQANQIRIKLKRKSCASISREYKVSESTIYRIRDKKSYIPRQSQ